jgi:KaiC/GvpD/RAD55 family RecA-like ATPase
MSEIKNIRVTDYLTNEIDFNDSDRLTSGYIGLDQSIKGFRRSGTYLVAGAEKSGKSSFLMAMLIHFLSLGKKVAVFDTELTGLQFYARLVAIKNCLSVSEAEEDQNLIKNVRKEFDNQILRFDSTTLSKDGKFDIELTLDLANKANKQLGAEVLIFDNLTTYQSQNSTTTYTDLPAAMTKIITLAKQLKVWSFVVTHAKDQVKVSEVPKAVKTYIDDNEPQRIFTNSIALIRKPTSADIYGGAQAKSQFSGTLIVWRPYQEYRDSTNIKRLTTIVVSGFRDGATKDVLMDFDEEKVTFTETDLEKMSFTQKINSMKNIPQKPTEEDDFDNNKILPIQKEML